MADTQIDLHGIQDAVMAALPRIRDEIALLIDGAPEDEPALGTLRRLLAYQSSRSQAVLYLVTSGMAWDAEIILRSVYEATVRLLYLSLAAREEREARVREYWEVLGAIGDRRRAVKSEISEGIFRKHDGRSAAIFAVFQDPNLFAAEPQAPKAARKAVEQKWSFAEIVAALGRQHHPEIGGLKELAGYLHFYGNASHLLHADPAALGFMHDRATRPPEEGAFLAASHICRIFTDLVGLSYLCSDAIRVMLGGEFADAQALHRSIVRCFELTAPVTSAFYNTQADLYRRHGRAEFSEGIAE